MVGSRNYSQCSAIKTWNFPSLDVSETQSQDSDRRYALFLVQSFITNLTIYGNLDPKDWIDINGGCRKWCQEVLPCNHNCILRCHP